MITGARPYFPTARWRPGKPTCTDTELDADVPLYLEPLNAAVMVCVPCVRATPVRAIPFSTRAVARIAPLSKKSTVPTGTPADETVAVRFSVWPFVNDVDDAESAVVVGEVEQSARSGPTVV